MYLTYFGIERTEGFEEIFAFHVSNENVTVGKFRILTRKFVFVWKMLYLFTDEMDLNDFASYLLALLYELENLVVECCTYREWE